MRKTYFNLVDQLNFYANNIKIKGNAVIPLERQESGGIAIFGSDSRQIYQSVLASQPQMNSVSFKHEIPVEAYLGVLNSTPQFAIIGIEGNKKDGYVVKTSTNLNQVSTRDASATTAKVEKTETIVVAGLQVEGNFKYQFIETALHDIDVLIEQGKSPSDITLIVFWHDSVYQHYDLEHFQETADNLGINLEKVESKDQFINYINTKNKNGGGDKRSETKISYISVFGHGQTPRFTGGTETQLSFGYNLDLSKVDLEKTINFLQSDIEKIKPEAFALHPLTYFFTCNTGTADENGLRFAQLWANKTKGNTYAFKNARSNYIFINASMDEISIAFNLPGKDADFSVSDIINGIKEKINDSFSSISTEILTKIFGDDVREMAEYASSFIVLYPVSEEWKIKRERGEDRERVDKNENKFGYADKGCVQYPMINNIYDDWDIIQDTWWETRGFKKFTPR